jgi:hypothetical protein
MTCPWPRGALRYLALPALFAATSAAHAEPDLIVHNGKVV